MELLQNCTRIAPDMAFGRTRLEIGSATDPIDNTNLETIPVEFRIGFSENSESIRDRHLG
jgi:hypothetical protein